MIIVLKPGVTHEQVEAFSTRLEHQHSVKVNAWYGEHSVVLGLLGDTATVDIESVGAQDIVQSVKRVQEPYKKANRKFHPDDTVIDLGDGSVIGGGRLGIIAGPCSVECEEQIVGVAEDVKGRAPLSCEEARSSPAPPPMPSRGCGPAASSCSVTPGKRPACPSSPRSCPPPIWFCLRTWTSFR